MYISEHLELNQGRCEISALSHTCQGLMGVEAGLLPLQQYPFTHMLLKKTANQIQAGPRLKNHSHFPEV